MNKLLQTTGRCSAFSVFIKSALLGLAVILCAGNELRAQTWTPVGAENDINAVASNHSSVTTVQVLVNGVSVTVPYVLYMESSVVKVKRYIDGVWETVGGNVSDGTADHPYIFSDPTGKLYVSYVDFLNASKLAVKTFKNGQWEALGGVLHVSTGSAAWNGNNNQNGNLHWMAFDSNNTPHVIHHDQGASFLPYVKRFNGTAWEQVGTGSVAAAQSSGLGIAIDQTDNTIFASFTAAGGNSTGLPNIATLPPSGGAWVLIGAPIPATNAGRLAAIALDGDNNPILGYANSGSSGRISAFKYNRSTQTWGARQVLGTAATFTAVRMARSANGDVYITGVDSSTPKVWRLITGATGWEQLWDGTNQIDISGGDGRTSVAIGADNKQYFVHVRANTATTPVNTPRLKIFQAPASITYPGSNAICAGESLQLTSSVSSGNQWYKEGVAISDATEQTYIVTAAGHYTVKAGTTLTSNTVKITVSTPPIATITPGGALTTGVVLSANTGTGYTYQWTQDGSDISGATSANYTTTTAGSYRVKVTSGACITTSDASVVVDPTAAPTISYTGTTTFCEGGNLVLASSASSANQWYKDGVAITDETGTTYTATTSGTYTVTANGSSASTAVSVTVNPSPTATVTPNGPLVTGVVLTANAGTGYTFQWTKDGVNIDGATNADYTASTVGAYRVKVTLGSCTTISDASNVANTIPVPTISYTGATTFCQGGGLVLTSSSTSGNQWNKDGVAISNETSSTYTVTESGSYTVTTGPTTSTAVDVLVNPAPTATVSANGSLDLVSGGSVVLTANSGSGYTFQWTKDGEEINLATNTSYTATTAGSYAVKITSNGCTTLSGSSIVTAPPTISYTGSASFCQGESLVLTSSATSGNQWYKDGVAITNATGSTYTVTSSGSYTVKIGPTPSTAVNVTVNPIPTATITANGPLQFAQGGNVVLSANTGTGYTYQWSKDGVDINAATNANYTATTPGSYRVKVSQNGCTGISSASVIVYIPTISYSGATALCEGQSVVLTSSANSGNQWFKDSEMITGANGVTYTATSSGTYSVTAQGSSASSGVSVTVNPLPVSTITAQGPVLFKTGGSVILSASTGSGYTYKWFKNGTEITGAVDATYTATQSGSYTLTTTSNSCSTTSAAVEISSVFALPSNNFGVSVMGESCKTSSDGKILVTAAQNLNYTATLTSNGTITTYPFTANLQIPNLSAGSYSLCISVEGQPGFSQCYDNLVVVEPNDLSIYSSVNESDQTITLSLNGGKKYNIKINGINHSTTKSSITLPLSGGDNRVLVSTDSECQGVVEKLISINDKVLIYPNPFEDILSLTLNNRSSKTSIQVKSMTGALVYSKSFTSTDIINLELSHLSTGMYLLQLSLDNSESFYKVIKR